MNKPLLDTDTYSEILKAVNPTVAQNAASYRQQHGVHVEHARMDWLFEPAGFSSEKAGFSKIKPSWAAKLVFSSRLDRIDLTTRKESREMSGRQAEPELIKTGVTDD